MEKDFGNLAILGYLEKEFVNEGKS